MSWRDREEESEFPQHLRGRPLFGGQETYTSLAERFERDETVEAVPLTDDFTYETFRCTYGPDALPLFPISDSEKLEIYSEESAFLPEAGQVLVALLCSGEEDTAPLDDDSTPEDGN